MNLRKLPYNLWHDEMIGLRLMAVSYIDHETLALSAGDDEIEQYHQTLRHNYLPGSPLNMYVVAM